MTWLNSIIQGIMLGGFYAILACGLSLMFGVMRIINLAHGDLIVVGAYVGWLVVDRLHVNPFLGMAIVLPVMYAVGWALQRGMLGRSLKSGMLIPLLTTFGLGILIQNALLQAFSPDVHSLGGQAGRVVTASWRITDEFSIPALGILILGVAVCLLGGIHMFLARTSAGRAMRATAQDPDTAALVGVNSQAVYARAAGIALGTAGLAALFLSLRGSFAPGSGPSQLIYAFEAVTIGGFGSLWGTLAGGLVLGVAQNIGARINPQYASLAGHLVFLVIVTFRSGGILVRRRNRT
jgi:branched-chain amino acid transport system permease protein